MVSLPLGRLKMNVKKMTNTKNIGIVKYVMCGAAFGCLASLKVGPALISQESEAFFAALVLRALHLVLLIPCERLKIKCGKHEQPNTKNFFYLYLRLES